VNNEKFKLITRRILAVGIALPIAYSLCFGLIYGILTEATEIVTLCAGILGTGLGAIIGFYFKSKVQEE